MSADFGYDITDTVGAVAVTQYDLVKTAGALVVSAAVTDDCIGVVQDGAAIGALVRVRIFGVTRVVAADDSISAFQDLSPAADGQVDGHAGTTTHPIVGMALEASAAQADEILAFIGFHSFRAGYAA